MPPIPPRRTRPTRQALTLLEMVAAMVLVALLFAAITSLLRGFADQRRAIDRISDRQPRTQLLAEQLRRDLTGARFVQHGPAGLRLSGTIAQDWTTRLPTGRRAEVVYRVARIGDQSWLLRHELHLDEASTQRSREEPLWRGAAGIELVLFEETSVDDEGQRSPQTATAGMRPAPARMQVLVRRDDGQHLLNLRVVHHWEDS